MRQTRAVPPQYKREFKSALDHLESGRYQQAIEDFTNLAKKQKTGHLKWSALFNAGLSLFKAGAMP